VKRSYVILLIENDQTDTFFFRQALSSCDFIRAIAVVENAALARDYMEGHGPFSDRAAHPIPDLIVADIEPADERSRQLLQWLRTDLAYAGVPVLVWSSRLSPEGVQAILQAGASAHESKTPAFRRLRALITEVIEDLDSIPPK
jgi:CheY-like chemotaxis protein